MEYNLADLFENAVDAFAERECIVAEGQRRTSAQLDARANQLAHHLAANGIGPGDHVGIYAYNSVEWVEALWAVFKLRAIWININFRYVEDELAYIFPKDTHPFTGLSCTMNGLCVRHITGSLSLSASTNPSGVGVSSAARVL